MSKVTMEFEGPSYDDLQDVRADMSDMEKRLLNQIDGLRGMMLQLMDAFKDLRKEVNS